MREHASPWHRLRLLLQQWLQVSPYVAAQFGTAGSDVLVEPGVHLSDPGTVYLADGCAIYRGATVLTGPGLLHMGRRSHLAGGVYVNALRAGVYIGEGTAVGPLAVLLSYSNAVVPGQSIDTARIEADLRIGDDVFVGAGAILLPGVSIGDGAVVAAGAVVRQDVGPGEIVGGVPARRLGHRR